jgi:hypothetical protein
MNKTTHSPEPGTVNPELRTQTSELQRNPGKTMHSPDIKFFIRRHSHLFWYSPEDKKEDISESFLVETILNYGDLKSVKELISLLGIQKVAAIFFDSIHKSERRKGNYNELTRNFFTLLFKSYMDGNQKYLNCQSN